MNCIIHNDTPAVGNCGKCGFGICSKCVQNSVPMQDGKTYCKNCATQSISLYIDYLKAQLGKVRTKKIVWTAILAIGGILLIYGIASGESNPDAVWSILGGIVVWACAGATDRFLIEKSEAQKFEDALVWRDAMVGHNYVWGFWLGKFLFWATKALYRGLFFPLFYAYFMLMGAKNLNKEIAEQQAILDNLAQSA